MEPNDEHNEGIRTLQDGRSLKARDNLLGKALEIP